MTNRRSFFQSIAKAAAIVALAPRLAFRTNPIEYKVSSEGVVAELNSYWKQSSKMSACYSDEYVQAMKEIFKQPYGRDDLVKTELNWIGNQRGPLKAEASS